MRVTSNSFSSEFTGQLQRLTARAYNLQRQAASGQRITTSSEDPSAAQRVLDNQANIEKLAQYKKNINNLSDQASASYEILRGLKRVSDRASEIATLADGTKSQADLDAYATELNQLIQQAVQTANGKYKGAYLLAGTESNEAPFTITYDANQNVTGVTYNGNQAIAETEIAEGSSIAVLNPGANDTGSGPRGLVEDSRYGADLFSHLISLRDHLVAGDTSAIASTDRQALEQDEENSLFHLANHGAVTARLETASTATSKQTTNTTSEISRDLDADLVETITWLNQVQTAYSAALQSGSTVMSTSLMDYLR